MSEGRGGQYPAATAPIPEVSSRLLANSVQSEVLLLYKVIATHLPAGLSSQRSPPSVSPFLDSACSSRISSVPSAHTCDRGWRVACKTLFKQHCHCVSQRQR